MKTAIFFEGEALAAMLKLCDTIEVQGVAHDPISNSCEPVSGDRKPDFYSVYCHYSPTKRDDNFGGVECLADFATRELATVYAEALGLPVRQY